jgi:hypothetical protein
MTVAGTEGVGAKGVTFMRIFVINIAWAGR